MKGHGATRGLSPLLPWAGFLNSWMARRRCDSVPMLDMSLPSRTPYERSAEKRFTGAFFVPRLYPDGVAQQLKRLSQSADALTVPKAASPDLPNRLSIHSTPATPTQKRDCCTTGVVSFGRCSDPGLKHFCTLFYNQFRSPRSEPNISVMSRSLARSSRHLSLYSSCMWSA